MTENSVLHQSWKQHRSCLLVMRHKRSSRQQNCTSLWSKAAIQSLATVVCTDVGGSPSWTTTGLSYETESPATHTIVTAINQAHNNRDL